MFSRKWFFGGLVLLLAIGLVTPAVLAADGSLDRVKKAGKLVIGVDDTYAPM